MSGDNVSITDIEHVSELFAYRLLFEKNLSAEDWSNAILYGEKLASAHLRYGNMLFHGTVKEWLGDIYLKVGEEEKASLSFSRAIYVYETLGYSSKTCKVLDKMGIRHRKWDSPLKGAIFGVLEESIRKDINLDLITSLSSEVDIDSLFRSSLWHLANFLPFWQGFIALYNNDEVEYLYSMDISGKRDISLEEFHQCSSTDKFVVYGSCMAASFPVSYNRTLRVHIERPFGGKEFTSGQRLLFEEFVSSLSSVTSSVLVKERGIVDSLTGVYTRWYIVRRLEELLNTRTRTGEDVSVLFIDVDNFKMVNDIYGHRIGDMVLKRIAYAIKDSVRSTDMVGRYGGDEFIVIMPATDIDKSLIVAHRIINTVKKYLSGMEEAVGVSVSIGISSTRLCRKVSPQMLIESADKAMYMSKKAGKSRATIYDGS
jgi:diguanylate cyclase (GGDEF)-like protein